MTVEELKDFIDSLGQKALQADVYFMVWYAVYPGSEKLDLGPKECVALFEFESHAKEFAKKYGEFGYVEPIEVTKGSGKVQIG